MPNVIYSCFRLILIFSLIILVYGCNRKENEENYGTNVHSFLTTQTIKSSLNALKGENKLLLIINFDDFSCQPCYDDFLDLCDTLTAHFEEKEIEPPVLMAIKEGNQLQLDNPERLKVWQTYNNARFNSIVISDSLFKVYFKSSTVMVVRSDTLIVLRKELPIGKKTKLQLLEFL
ncbi:MAG: hypothetical protein ACPL25_10290 [Ignavibacteria bacterium]